MTISIITINYRSQEYLPGFLASIYTHLISHAQRQYNFEILIVNNEETPLDIDIPAGITPKIINAGQNLGFASANNVAAKRARGEFLLFINPDTELKDSSLLKMFDYLAEHPEVGILGPKIVLAKENRPQPWTSGNKTNLWDILFRHSIGKPWNKKEIIQVDWVTGTALLIRKSDFLSLGGFDEQFFMYFEDQDLCLRLKSLRKKVLFFPDARIVHYDGKSWNNQSKQKSSFYVSQDYFFQKHHGALQSQLLKLLRLPMKIMLKLK